MWGHSTPSHSYLGEVRAVITKLICTPETSPTCSDGNIFHNVGDVMSVGKPHIKRQRNVGAAIHIHSYLGEVRAVITKHFITKKQAASKNDTAC